MADPQPGIEDVASFMCDRSLMLVTAESCTGGLIAATLADMPGAGQLLDCAFVTYSPEAKKRCLSVKPETLESCNLTSEAVAREMAVGALKNSRANVAVSNTGVVDGTDRDIPAGTQCFAWAFKAEASGQPSRSALFSETRRFAGDRTEIRTAAARYALERIPHYFLIQAKSAADPRSG
ncbi:CinA family protein [Pollutimonas sp. H1-120]|uniref:CinA family protein n=1 Tax=Pollutimonas sp. H1-120 TaxID=3148824 RepID=UPI003B52C147